MYLSVHLIIRSMQLLIMVMDMKLGYLCCIYYRYHGVIGDMYIPVMFEFVISHVLYSLFTYQWDVSIICMLMCMYIFVIGWVHCVVGSFW